MRTMKKTAIIIGMGWISLSVAQAQQDSTLNRTVVVENQYNPTVMDASKINVLPKVEEPAVPKTHIDYATSVRPVSSWNYHTMSPIVKDWKSDAAYRGYFHAGYGNNGNVDVRLGYVWDITSKDRLNVMASLDGWNGELPWADADWSSRLYNTKVGLDYRHSFKRLDFWVGGQYQSRVFNFLGNPDAGNKQHQTLMDGYVGFASTDKYQPIQFEAQVGMKSYQEKHLIMNNGDKNKETHVYVSGDVWKSFQNGNRWGLKVNVSNYSYAGESLKDWTALEFNPYMLWQGDDWKVRFGLHLDSEGGEDNKFYVSPDVNAEYIFSDSYVLFAKAEGGRKISSLYEMAQITPYFNVNGMKPTYVTLDASVGLKASPLNGWWFLLSGGYQIRENDVCWELVHGYYPLLHAQNISGKTNVLYGTAELKYDYKDLWNFSLKGTYHHWSYKNSDWYGEEPTEAALSLKPELEMNAEVGVKVMEGLRIHAGYDYVKRCNGYAGNPVSNLRMGADYNFWKNLGVFVRFNNLLNKEYIDHYVYPAQNLNFLGGVSFRF